VVIIPFSKANSNIKPLIVGLCFQQFLYSNELLFSWTTVTKKGCKTENEAIRGKSRKTSFRIQKLQSPESFETQKPGIKLVTGGNIARENLLNSLNFL
jgi:hypothetical protein